MAGRSHLAVNDGPHLLSNILGELSRVSNDDNTTLEGLDGLGQGTKGVTVQVVSRLIKNDEMGTLPRAGGEDDLDTLATGQTAHAGVGDELGIETEVGAVGLNLLADKGTELTAGKSLLLIDLSDHLGVGHQDLATRNPGVVSSHHGSPLLVLHADVLTKGERALILVRVLELAAGVDTDDTALGALDLVDMVHSLLVLLGDDLVGTVHGLAILTSLETPLNVLRGSLVEVMVDVGESVLLDVGDTDVLVLVDLTGGGDQLTSQDVDEGGLSGTVGTNDGNTGAERALEGDVGDLRLGSTGVLEGHVADADNGLGLGLNTLKETGLGEPELHVGGRELVVRAGGRHALDELAQVTTVTLELEALVVNNVLDNVVKELAVVGDDDGRARGVDKVILEPLDVLHVKMVGGLVKQQDIGLLEHGTGKSQLHLPATRQSSDDAVNLGLSEAERDESLLDLLLGLVDADLGELLHGPLDDGLLSIGRVQIVLDVDSLDLALLREALDLLVIDGAHQGGLAGTVGAEQTITLATLQAQVGLVEQDLGTVGQVEGAVAKILTFLLIGLDGVLSLSAGKAALAESIGGILGLLLASKGGKEGTAVGLPGDELPVLLVNELATDGANVVDDGLKLSANLDLGQDSLGVSGNGSDVAILGELGSLAVLDMADALEGLETLLGLLAGLGISQVVVVLLKGGHQTGQESSHDLGVLDKLAHVVDNDGRLALDGSLALDETTLKKGHHDGKSGLVHISDEGGSTEQMDRLGDILGLGDTLDELGNEALDILVGDQGAQLLHSLVGGLLDLGLGVPHGTGDDGDQVGHAEGHLSGGRGAQVLDELEIHHLLGPLLRRLERVRQVGDDGLDSVGVGRVDDRLGGSLSGLLDGHHLVANGGEHVGEQGDEVGLDAGRHLRVVGDGLDGDQRALADGGILLVGDLLLQLLDGAGGRVSRRHGGGGSDALRVCAGRRTYCVGAPASSMSPLI